jgi:hypothetical protein
LEEAQKKAQDTESYLKKEKQIRETYAQTVSRQLPTSDTQKTPEAQFDEDVAALCRQLKIEKPQVSRGNPEQIPGVADYEFITVNLKEFQTWPEVARLLKSFDENWYLIKQLDILSPNEGGVLTADIRLARVVKISDAEKKKREAESKQPARKRASAGTEHKSVGQPAGLE